MNNPWNDIAPPRADVSARRVDPSHGLDLFWGRDPQSRCLFILEIESAINLTKKDIPDLSGIQIVITFDKIKKRLILVLKESDNWELFLALCNDLIEATRGASTLCDAISIIKRRLRRWQKFMMKTPSGILTEEEIKGLIGELVFLKCHVIPLVGAGDALTCWKGPEGAPQDFNVGRTVIEVKCQSGATVPRIRISSSEQLTPQVPVMYLYVVTLGTSRNGDANTVSLPSLIRDITLMIEDDFPDAVEMFKELLFIGGYLESERYLEYSYLLVGERMFDVRDAFPRITTQNLPAGVSHVTYCIDLVTCEPFEITLEKWAGSYG
jgi:hypothetical protein